MTKKDGGLTYTLPISNIFIYKQTSNVRVSFKSSKGDVFSSKRQALMHYNKLSFTKRGAKDLLLHEK